MKLSSRGRYGLKAMYALSLAGEEPLSIKAIAASQDIPESYLEQIISLLKKDKLVRAIRGAQGGYVLSKPANEMTIGEILRSLEGSTSITDCLGDKHCGESCKCPSRSVFERIQQSIDDVLNDMTLDDMTKENAVCENKGVK